MVVWYNKGTILLCIVCLIVGGFIGRAFFPKTITDTRVIEKPAEIKEVVKTKTDTVIQYVPKEVYIREDGTKEAEKTDVQADIKQPIIAVKVNGQPYEFGLLQGETQKFEQGKVTLNQSSEIGINLEVKPQIIDRTKTGGIDLFVGKYSGIGLQFNRIGVDIGVDRHGDQDYRFRWKAVQW
jgi:hypothetical protein